MMCYCFIFQRIFVGNLVKLIYLIVLDSDQCILLLRHYKTATAIYWRRIGTPQLCKQTASPYLHCFKSDTFFFNNDKNK